MKVIYCFLLFVILNLVVSEIQEVDEKKFKQIRKKHKSVIVQFYSHQCGHCKALIGEFQRLDDMLIQQKINVPLLKINAKEERNLVKEFKISGFPTILLVQNNNGITVKYKGLRTAEKITQFIKDEISFVSYHTVKNEQEIKDILENLHEFDSINIFYGLKDRKETDNFKKLSYQLRNKNMQFYLYEVKTKEEQVLYSHREKQKPKSLNTQLTLNNMKAFVQINELADLVFLNKKQLKVIDNYVNIPVFIVQLSYKQDPLNSQIKKTLKLAKEKLGHKAIMTYFYQTDRQLHQQLYRDSNHFDLNVFQMIIQVSTISEYKYYVIEGQITLQNILNAFDLFNQGKLKKTPKSENIPPHQQMSVKHVVYNNYNQLINTKNHEFLILFQRETCPYCRKIKPIFKELAEEFLAFGAQIYLGTYDITLNDQVFPIQHVPALVLYTDGKPQQLEIKSVNKLEILNQIKAKSQLVSQGFNFSKIMKDENVQQNVQEEGQQEQIVQQDVKREDL